MGAVAAIGAVGSLAQAGLSAAGQIQAANARSAAQRRQAELERKQAEEVIKRSRINIQRAKLQAEELSGSQVSAFAASGVELSGSALIFIEEQAARAREEIADIQIDARQKAENIILGAEARERAASGLKSAALLGAGATIVGGVSSAARAGLGGIE